MSKQSSAQHAHTTRCDTPGPTVRSELTIVSHDTANAEVRVLVSGDIDLATAPQLRDKLHAHLDHGGGTVVLDCSDLTFIDASGISVLLDLYQNMGHAGRDLRIEHLHPSHRRIFEILGLTESLHVQPN
jgi:anti-sigma B factor antagonist